MKTFLRNCVVLCAGVLMHATSARAQSPCDPLLTRNDGSTGYHQRADRCEGIYRREVASSFGAQLVSFTAASPLDDLCITGQPIHLTWPSAQGASAGQPIHVQVESLRRQLYYRLDTNRPSGSTSWEWPIEPRCSNEVRLKVRELAILARTKGMVGAKAVELLMPVGLATKAGSGAQPPYRAVIVPGGRVTEIYVSLWNYSNPQAPVRIIAERPLDMKPYPAGVPFVVALTTQEVKDKALYRLLSSVEFESGEREAVDVYFLNGN
jgi:hypothetical protein